MHDKILKTSNFNKLLIFSLVLVSVLFLFYNNTYLLASSSYIAPWVEAGDTGNLLSGWSITGATSGNTNNGVLYWSYTGIESACGASAMTDSRDGKTYSTVEIGTQCWMAENLDHDNGCTSITWVNSTDTGWCGYYTGGPFANEGLLYQWSTVMAGSTACNGTGEPPNDKCATPVQGICPDGWHIPSHYEFTTLERAVCTSASCATDFAYNTSATGWKGTTEGDKLKKAGLCQGRIPCGTSGFNVLGVGLRASTTGTFDYRTTNGYFWSSSQTSGINAWRRLVREDDATVWRDSNSKMSGHSVRCIKDSLFASLSLTVSLYSDSAKTQLVAQGTASALGEITLTAQNDSGLSGTVVADSLGTDTDTGNTLTGTLEDTTPPVQSNHNPASASTISDTTQDITFDTDENAICKISLTNQAYADMTGDVCPGGGTQSHTCTTPDLGSDGEKNVYIACTDGTNADTAETNTNLTYTLSTNAIPNIPVLVSPANASYTNDNTPTLSATYSDSDTNDTGITNYRISSSSLEDCINNISIVASGTSSETSTNNETTTWTPISSIGEDGTYYWCAQNNDGTATSSWSEMGNFILDTTPPPIPTANPTGGIFNSAQAVSLSSAGSSAIYYTTNGTDPTTSSTLYASPINITANLTLKALAVDAVNNESDFLTAEYVIDSDAPELSSIQALPTDSSAKIRWSTNEDANSKVDYGLTTSLESNTVNGTLTTSHEITLSSLLSCSTYHYKVSSTDEANNQTASSLRTFYTAGCETSSIKSGSGSASYANGHTVSHTTQDGSASVTAPDGFYSAKTTAVQINALDTASAPTQPTGKSLVKDNFFKLRALTSDGEVVDSFDEPVTFTVSYGDETVQSFLEDTLDVYKYSGGTWVAQNCELNTSAKTLTCTLQNFSVYAVMGEEVAEQAGTTAAQITTSYSAPSPQACFDPKPASVSEIFQINLTTSSATLYFTPILGNTTYHISYSSLNPNAEQHSVEVSLSGLGVQNYTIHLLSPNTVYYFKVRGHNGCMPGDWSEIKQVTTLGAGGVFLPPSSQAQPSTQSSSESSEEEKPSTVEELTKQIDHHRVTILVKSQGKPLANAQLQLVDSQETFTTNDEGKVVIENVKPGKHLFNIVHQAYASEQEIEITGDDQDVDVVINLQMKNSIFSTQVWVGLIVLTALSTLTVAGFKRKRMRLVR